MLIVKYDKTLIDSYREPITYGDWKEEWDFKVKGVEHFDDGEEIVCSDYYDKFNIPGAPGQPVYVLVMRYADGDSFGHSDGNGDILMAYTDKAMAKEALGLFKAAFDAYGDSKHYRVEIPVQTINGDRVMFECPNPASGYFETMRSIELEHLIIT